MPFTPFHFGLGVLAKAISPKKISLSGFCLSQIIVDIEPGFKMATNSASDLHSLTHNYPCALILAGVAFVIWRFWESIRPKRFMQERVSSPILFLSCVFGAVSHVFLDGMYHAGMKMAQYQWDIARMSFGALSGAEALCVGFLLLGAAIFAAKLLLKTAARKQ